jgi:uncharacterized protein (TIGR02466 family)
METYSIFPTELYLFKSEDIDLIKLNSILIAMSSKTPSVTISNIGGYQSPNIANNINMPTEVKTLIDFMKTCMSEVLDKNYRLKYPDAWFSLDNCWVNINEEHDFNQEHLHPNTSYSCCFYVSDTKGGSIKFTDPRTTSLMQGSLSLDDVFHSVDPPAGYLILFPAWVPHSTLPFVGEGQRVTVAANFITHKGG